MMLKQIPYETNFFWEGVRYTQVIRPKNLKNDHTITCRPTRKPNDDWVEVPVETEVKPVIILKASRRDI